MFKAEPQPPARKLLYRRGGRSHILSHSLSHSLNHRTYGLRDAGPITPPAREGHRRRFREADKRQIGGGGGVAGASHSEAGAPLWATRVLFRDLPPKNRSGSYHRNGGSGKGAGDAQEEAPG